MVLVVGHVGVAARRRRVVRGDAAPAAGGEAEDQAVPASLPISFFLLKKLSIWRLEGACFLTTKKEETFHASSCTCGTNLTADWFL